MIQNTIDLSYTAADYTAHTIDTTDADGIMSLLSNRATDMASANGTAPLVVVYEILHDTFRVCDFTHSVQADQMEVDHLLLRNFIHLVLMKNKTEAYGLIMSGWAVEIPEQGIPAEENPERYDAYDVIYRTVQGELRHQRYRCSPKGVLTPVVISPATHGVFLNLFKPLGEEHVTC